MNPYIVEAVVVVLALALVGLAVLWVIGAIADADDDDWDKGIWKG